MGFAFFFVLALISPGGMGLGDVKLAMMLGAFLGWSVVVAIVAALVASLVPSVAILLVRGLEGRKVGIPFGPFLAAGRRRGAALGPGAARRLAQLSGVDPARATVSLPP